MKFKIAFLLLFLLLFLLPLGVRPMFTPDETRYAEIAREMIVSGDWTVPTLNGVRYFEKPILGYWLFASSMKIFGMNAFALRLPAALCAGLAAWFLMFLVRRAGGSRREEIFSGMIFLTMPLVFFLASTGILDGIFSLFTTLSAGFFFLASEKKTKRGRRILYLLLCGFAAGAGFLTKGFLAFAVPALPAAAYLIWNKRWRDLFVLPWLPLVAALCAIAPWAWAIHGAEADFWHYFVVVEHWNRFFGGEDAQHAEPFFFFLPYLLGGAAPWFLLSPWAVMGLKNRIFHEPLLRFSVCWFVLPFLMFSVSSGKLATYILPCFPPLAVLFATGLASFEGSERFDRAFRILCLSLAGILVFGLAGVLVNHVTAFPVMALFGPKDKTMLLIFIAGALAAAGLLFFAARAKTMETKILRFGAFLFPVIFCAHFILPAHFQERKCPMTTFSAIPPLSKDIALVSFRYPFQDVCWYFRRSDVFMLSPGEIDYGLRYPDARHRLLSPESFRTLVREKKAGGGVLLIMPQDRYFESKATGKYPSDPEWEILGSDDNCYIIVKY